jgi:hypothetical protein
VKSAERNSQEPQLEMLIETTRNAKIGGITLVKTFDLYMMTVMLTQFICGDSCLIPELPISVIFLVLDLWR